MKSSTLNIVLIGVFALAGIWMYRGGLNPAPSPGPGPGPAPTPVVDKFDGLRKVLAQADKADAYQVGLLYTAAGDQVSRSAPMTNGLLRNWVQASETYFVAGTNLANALPGFGTAMKELVTDVIGDDDRQLSAAEMKQVAELFIQVGEVCGVK